MFSRMIGKRAAALATSLAVVIGLAISPALVATAAEGDELAVLGTSVAEPVEESNADAPAEEPPAETPAGRNAAAIDDTGVDDGLGAENGGSEPGDQNSEDEGTPAEAAGDEKPAPMQSQMRSSSPTGAEPMGMQSMGTMSTGILPESLPSEFLLGQPLDVQFYGVDADRWQMNFDFLSDANLSASGHLTGYFSRPGNHTLTVRAQNHVFGPIYNTVESRQYTFTVVPAVLTSSLPGATVGSPYSQALSGTLIDGVVHSNTFSKVSGELPPGLSLSSSGVISGTVTSIPQNPKTYTFEVRLRVWNVISGTHDSAPKTLSITVGYPAPTWNAITLPEATVGVAYPATSVTANGNGWSVGVYSATGLPNGLALSAAGVITGTPLFNSGYSPIQTVSVTFTADNGSTTTMNADIVVKTPPVLVTTSPLPNAVVGTSYTTTISSTGPAVSYSLTKNPAGMVIDSATGVISGWTPTDETNERIRVKVENAAGSDELQFVIKPFAVPAITTTTLVNGIVGQSYLDQIVFDGRNAKIKKVAGALPNGLTLSKGTVANGGGLVSGTPTTSGAFTFTVEVTNASGTVTSDFEIRVHSVPVIHVTTLARAIVGQTYTDSVQFSGLDAEATILKGSLPTGMTLNTDGTFSGAPGETGVFGFTVKVSNPAGSVKHRYRIVSFDVPAFQTTTLDQGIVGMPYSQQLDADGHKVRFVVPKTSSLPAGMTLDKSGLLHGTPSVAGDFTIDVRARNFAGTTVRQFSLTITQPAMALSSNNVIRGGQLTVSGTGYLPGDSLELWLHSTPVLLGTVTATGGTFSSTVVIPAGTSAGAHSVVVVGARSGTTSTPLTVSLPPVPAVTTPRSPAAPSSVDSAAESSAGVDEASEQSEETDTTQAEEELPTLDQPAAEGEAAAAAPMNWAGWMVGAFALLLAALLWFFILWRRRRAAEEN